MKQFLSSAVQLPPIRNAVAGTPSAAGSLPILASAWEASSAENENDFGLTRKQPCFNQRRPLVAPSLRLRANAANRSLLRWMRAAEQAAWQDADASALRALNHFQP